ncbi:hypothetical protein VTJ04DRAFT_3375 [Mycothermus thermophilus]|uniref:uncharacterized protein n=1 Tax=Humicola insolens TaxID=85995 RepID=UPI0037448A54
MAAVDSALAALETDFTVEGRKGVLGCPFAAKSKPVDGPQDSADATDPTPHKSSDPICAAMRDGGASATAPPSKCPIRFLDKHSPEEIARYVETHKHEIPRSHEVCVRRYQRDEEQLRKLDAKYVSLASMVEDLSHVHRPMLPPADDDDGGVNNNNQRDADRAASRRVEEWTRTVVVGEPADQDAQPAAPPAEDDKERESRFDRPLRDVRVGESPSRPWGISIPLDAGTHRRDPSRPRPVDDAVRAATTATVSGERQHQAAVPGKCPVDHARMLSGTTKQETSPPQSSPQPDPTSAAPNNNNGPRSSDPRPAFINLPEMAGQSQEGRSQPQIVFNISGPVFIGYPMEQAIEFMRQFRG